MLCSAGLGSGLNRASAGPSQHAPPRPHPSLQPRSVVATSLRCCNRIRRCCCALRQPRDGVADLRKKLAGAHARARARAHRRRARLDRGGRCDAHQRIREPVRARDSVALRRHVVPRCMRAAACNKLGVTSCVCAAGNPCMCVRVFACSHTADACFRAKDADSAMQAPAASHASHLIS